VSFKGGATSSTSTPRPNSSGGGGGSSWKPKIKDWEPVGNLWVLMSCHFKQQNAIEFNSEVKKTSVKPRQARARAHPNPIGQSICAIQTITVDCCFILLLYVLHLTSTHKSLLTCQLALFAACTCFFPSACLLFCFSLTKRQTSQNKDGWVREEPKSGGVSNKQQESLLHFESLNKPTMQPHPGIGTLHLKLGSSTCLLVFMLFLRFHVSAFRN
jgi:hypothetical protein